MKISSSLAIIAATSFLFSGSWAEEAQKLEDEPRQNLRGLTYIDPPPLPRCKNGEQAIRVYDLPAQHYSEAYFNTAHGVHGVTFSTPRHLGFEAKYRSVMQSVDGDYTGTLNLAKYYNGYYDPIHAEFMYPVEEVWVDMGDPNYDYDLLEIKAYDEFHQMIAHNSKWNPKDSYRMKRLYVHAPNIKYVVFEATHPALNGNSAYWDKFTFCPKKNCRYGCGK